MGGVEECEAGNSVYTTGFIGVCGVGGELGCSSLDLGDCVRVELVGFDGDAVQFSGFGRLNPAIDLADFAVRNLLGIKVRRGI